MIYYPNQLYKQGEFSRFFKEDFKLENSEILCKQVLSIPIHSELDHYSQ